MSKSTPFKASKSNAGKASEEAEPISNSLPTSPTKETLSNIMALAKSYSVRNSRILGKTGFMLN